MNFKKPKFWDLKEPNLISYLLLPLTLPIKINNLLLDFKSKKKSDKIKTICVGNIYVGGTGKTPTSIKLFQIFKELSLDVSVGKKEYSSQLDEITILNKKTNLITAHKRKNILSQALKKHKDVLIFDDGLQDKTINYDIQIVCFDGQNWIGNGFLIPSGPLREKINSLKKYDVVFIKSEKPVDDLIVQSIRKVNPKIKIFGSFYKPINIKEFDLTKKYLIFSGIGNSKDFKNILIRNNFTIVGEIIYPDHFNYNKNDINKIKDQALKLDAEIITTEKDYVKVSQIDNNKINFLEIDLIIKNQEDLIKYLKSELYD